MTDKKGLLMAIVVGILIAIIVVMGIKLNNGSETDQVFKEALRTELESETSNAIDELVEEMDIMVKYKSDYMEGCMEAEDISYDYCLCTFNFMGDKWSDKKIIEESIKIVSGDISDDVIDLMIESYVECEEYLVN